MMKALACEPRFVTVRGRARFTRLSFGGWLVSLGPLRLMRLWTVMAGPWCADGINPDETKRGVNRRAQSGTLLPIHVLAK